ncbi:MAG: OadG family protein [Bacteroidales bacterium]|nr:OadG family protein [Candidatus Cryptobacteroides equifaecalis]
MDNLGTGLTLMLVGMVTVFAILMIVIYGSRLLIQLINRIAPEEQAPAKKESASPAAVDANAMAILEAAVAQITGGTGRIAKVTKI